MSPDEAADNARFLRRSVTVATPTFGRLRTSGAANHCPRPTRQRHNIGPVTIAFESVARLNAEWGSL